MDELWTVPVLVTAGLVLGFGAESAVRRRPWAVPAAAIYGVVAFWYLGNIFQSGMPRLVRTLGEEWVEWGLVQVSIFTVAFRFLVPWVCPQFLPPGRPLFDPARPLGNEEATVTRALAAAWAMLTLVGFYRVDGDILSILIPPLSDEPKSMFGRAAIGGSYDFLVSIAGYSYLAVGGLLGAVAVLASRPGPRLVGTILCGLTLLPNLFQHARHTALAIVMPGLLTLMLVKDCTRSLKAVIVLATLSFLVAWFSFMTAARSGQRDWNEAFAGTQLIDSSKDADVFVGLEMFDELCHIGRLKDNGKYDPGFFGEYYQEAVSFVPRGVWPGKPLVGFDYAIARGFEDPQNPGSVRVILSRGLIGQGVANCGGYLGPVVAALVAALWAGVLTRMWAQRGRPARLGLYLIGLALTINMGRGVSLLALFPFVFAYAGVRFLESRSSPARPARGDAST